MLGMRCAVSIIRLEVGRVMIKLQTKSGNALARRVRAGGSSSVGRRSPSNPPEGRIAGRHPSRQRPTRPRRTRSRTISSKGGGKEPPIGEVYTDDDDRSTPLSEGLGCFAGLPPRGANIVAVTLSATEVHQGSQRKNATARDPMKATARTSSLR